MQPATDVDADTRGSSTRRREATRAQPRAAHRSPRTPASATWQAGARGPTDAGAPGGDTPSRDPAPGSGVGSGGKPAASAASPSSALLAEAHGRSRTLGSPRARSVRSTADNSGRGIERQGSNVSVPKRATSLSDETAPRFFCSRGGKGSRPACSRALLAKNRAPVGLAVQQC
jgi:hypothetical protein